MEKQDGGRAVPQPIPFHYIKSNFFRVIRVDGAIGGFNPRGVIQAALYSERIPIPQRTVQEVKTDGTLGEEIPGQRVIRDGLVREVEVELMLDVETARVLGQWLLDNVKNAERVRAGA